MVERSEKVSSPSCSYGRKDLEFFKVYLPEFSSRELVIPPAFINLLGKPLPNQVVLLDEIGRLWNVETKTEEEERVVFRIGWENFANDHSLEFGNFLVFSYDGVSRFSVTIFDKNGCKKDLVPVTTKADRSRVSVEKEPVLLKPVYDISTKRCCAKSRKRVSVKEEEPSDPCEMASMVPEKKKKHKGFEEPVYKPKNPHFVRNITNGSRRQMEIPTTFLKTNGIEIEEDIELCDENGKKWPMKIVIHDRGRRFSPGLWLSFCDSHKLSTSNKCLFEFIVTSNGTCNQVLVRILRGTMLTTVTSNSYQVLAM